MNFSIAQIIRRLFAPRHELSCSWFLWQSLTAKLRERGRACSRESGAFLLGHRHDGRARIVDFILYDDLDPHALDTGIVHFDGRHFGALWDICKRRGLSVVADVHVHPGGSGQSQSDCAHPMISRAGHLALILPGLRPAANPTPNASASTAISATSAGTRCRRTRGAPSCTLDCEACHDDVYASRQTAPLVKQALDSGAAASIAEAELLFSGYRARPARRRR